MMSSQTLPLDESLSCHFPQGTLFDHVTVTFPLGVRNWPAVVYSMCSSPAVRKKIDARLLKTSKCRRSGVLKSQGFKRSCQGILWCQGLPTMCNQPQYSVFYDVKALPAKCNRAIWTSRWLLELPAIFSSPGLFEQIELSRVEFQSFQSFPLSRLCSRNSSFNFTSMQQSQGYLQPIPQKSPKVLSRSENINQ